jgi:hypothetical protein
MIMKLRAVERANEAGKRANALLWWLSLSPYAQYMAMEWGTVIVNTYNVHATYTYLYLTGFHIACMISLHISLKVHIPNTVS